MKLDYLKRITNSNNYIPEIDGIRFLAIASVVLMHLHTHLLAQLGIPSIEYEEYWLTLVLRDGQNGVLVFFVLSGFILGIPFAKHQFKGGKKIKLGEFYLRRLTRLEPPYIILMIIFFVIHVSFLGAEISEFIPRLLAGLTYSHFFFYNTWNPILPVTWSLSTEIQFYVLIPFLARLYRIKSVIARYTLIILIVLSFIYFGIHGKDFIDTFHLSKSIIYYASFFLLGLMLADLYVRKTEYFKKKHVCWDLVFVTTMAIVFIFGRDMVFPRYTRTFVMAPLFISAFKGRYISRFLALKFVSITGGMCYSIYLLHFPIIHGLFLFWKPSYDSYFESFLISSFVALPVIWFVSAVFFRIIEKPCMRGDWYKSFKFK